MQGALSILLDDVLTFLRGPLFLGLLSLLLVTVVPAAQGTLLRGYVEAGPKHEAQPSAEVAALAAANSFPESFAGVWKCVTVVIDSAVSDVAIGERVESQVVFAPQADGRIVAKWDQQGWAQSGTNITSVSEREAAQERTNFFVADGIRGAWAAHSHDHYLKIDTNRITASSYIDQYKNGQFLGRYRTQSMLYRVADDVAFAR